jgi:hypothetical protein
LSWLKARRHNSEHAHPHRRKDVEYQKDFSVVEHISVIIRQNNQLRPKIYVYIFAYANAGVEIGSVYIILNKKTTGFGIRSHHHVLNAVNGCMDW